MCFNDAVAFGVLDGLAERGLVAGRDLAVVGFDDVEAAAHAVPPLTTVRVDSHGLGEKAAQLLLQKVAAPTAPVPDFMGETQLVVRASCGAPRTIREQEGRGMSGRIGWGLIGASTIAREWMIDAIRAQPGGEVEAVLSSDAERGRRFAAENGIAASYTGLDELLADPAVDAVYISTTNELHRRPNAGGGRGRQARALREAAGAEHRRRQAHGRGLPEPPASSWAPTTICATPPRTAPCATRSRPGGSAGRWRRASSTPSTCRRTCRAGGIDRPEAGGGVVLDITVHDADTLRFVLDDEPVEVTALEQSRRHGPGPRGRGDGGRALPLRPDRAAPRRLHHPPRRHRLRGARERGLADRHGTS